MKTHDNALDVNKPDISYFENILKLNRMVYSHFQQNQNPKRKQKHTLTWFYKADISICTRLPSCWNICIFNYKYSEIS